MLANFFNSEQFRQIHTLSFSYVKNELYTQGLQRRISNDLLIYPVKFPDLSDYSKFPKWMPLLSRKVFMAFIRLVFHLPLLLYQVLVLHRLFKKINPDILHINNGGYPAANSARAASIAGKWAGISKVVMVVNNMAVDYRHYSRWFDYPIDRLVVRAVDIFITGSQAAGARLRTVLKLPVHQVRAIHNGITLRNSTGTVSDTRKRFGLGEFDGVIFGVVALLIPRKGHQVLLDAILTLVTDKKLEGNEFKVLIEGDGPLNKALVNFVTLNHLTPWVTFVGNEANVVDFMAALDVLILPSVQDEDFPNVILEAMALGKPVIASRLAGTPEQVMDGTTGYLVEPRNSTQLAEAVFKVMDNAEQRLALGRASLHYFRTHFTTQLALANYSSLYTELIGELP